jgi:Brp/Blh family beta-carotene 15,15'-monooxygenase
MKLAIKLNSIFIVCTLCCLLPGLFTGSISTRFDTWILAAVIFTTGIPHGAIDHIIYKNNVQGLQKTSPAWHWRLFFIPYIGLLILTVFCWMLLPAITFFVFLSVSCYHFGQSQLFYLQLDESKTLKVTLYLGWGVLLMGFLWLQNWQLQAPAIQTLFSWSLQMGGILYSIVLLLTIAAGLVTCFIFCLLLRRKLLPLKLFVQELLVLAVLLLMIRISSMYIAFAIYFGLWHSLRVVITEYQYLSVRPGGISLKNFIGAFIPFSAISIAGLLLLFLASAFTGAYISPFMLFLIFISSLTMPHAFVMQGMYHTLSKQEILHLESHMKRRNTLVGNPVESSAHI